MAILTLHLLLSVLLVIVSQQNVLAQPPPTMPPWQAPTDGWPPVLIQEAENGYPNPFTFRDRCQTGLAPNTWLCDPNKQLSGTDVTAISSSYNGTFPCKCAPSESVTVGIAVINSVRLLALGTLRDQMKSYSQTILKQWDSMHSASNGALLLFVSCTDKAVEVATSGNASCVQNIAANLINNAFNDRLAANVTDLTSCYSQIIHPTIVDIWNWSFIDADCLYDTPDSSGTVPPAAYIVPIVIIIVIVIVVLVYVFWHRSKQTESHEGHTKVPTNDTG